VKGPGLPTPAILVMGTSDTEVAEDCLTAAAFNFISNQVDLLSP
jgi:hypothetical protein